MKCTFAATLLASFAVIGGFSPALAATLSYRLLNIGRGHIDENRHYAVPVAFNNNGQVVGTDSPTNDTWNAFDAPRGSFKYFDSGFTENSGSLGAAINGLGQVVVNTNTDGFMTNPVMWDPSTGIKTPIPPLQPWAAHSFGLAGGINDSGQIVGLSGSESGYHAFLFDHGLLTDLTPNAGNTSAIGINNHGDIIGTGFLIHNGTFTGLSFSPIGIDNDGDILFQLPNGNPALYRYGKVTDLGPIGTAIGISRNGNIVGLRAGGTPFVRIRGVVYDVNLLGTNEWVDFYNYFSIVGINDSGQILGVGSYVSTPQGFVATISAN